MKRMEANVGRMKEQLKRWNDVEAVLEVLRRKGGPRKTQGPATMTTNKQTAHRSAKRSSSK